VGTIHAGFILQQIVMNPQEGRQRVHGVDDAEGVGELGAEAAQGVDDEVLIGDWMTDVDKSVSKALEAAAVIPNGKIALLQAVEVLESVDGALRGIVEEEATNGEPGGVSRRSAVEHHVANRLGHGEVDPRDDAVVDLSPLDVVQACLCVDGAVDMVEKTELAKGEFEERAPGGIIGLLKIQHVRHMVANVEDLHGKTRSDPIAKYPEE
jgi:hypothetical protein